MWEGRGVTETDVHPVEACVKTQHMAGAGPVSAGTAAEGEVVEACQEAKHEEAHHEPWPRPAELGLVPQHMESSLEPTFCDEMRV